MTDPILIRSPNERIALALHRLTLFRLLTLTGILGALALTALCLGSTTLSPRAVLATLVHPAGAEHAFVVHTLRLPRILLGALVGAALGIAGAVLQRLVRNPLASPDIIGISDGAAVGAVLFLTLAAGRISLDWLPSMALTGAGLTAALIYALAWRGGIRPVRLVLVGIAVAAALKAVVTLVLVMGPLGTSVQAYVWLTGSLYGAQWTDVTGLLPWVALLVPVVLLTARPLALFGLTDDQSRGLGLSLERCRWGLLACSAGLAGAAVAFAGGIAFVGLIAPHLARRLTGATPVGGIIGSGLTGAGLVLTADLIGRTAFPPQDVPAGVFVSAVGAPFFIYLLFRGRTGTA